MTFGLHFSVLSAALLVTPGPSPTGRSATTAAPLVEPTADAVRAALDRALAESDTLRSIRLSAECPRAGRLPAIELFGRGFGIWDGRRQFALDPAVVAGLVATLRDGGFAELSPSYGGRRAPDAVPGPSVGDAGAALKVTCRLRFALGPLRKQVVQLDEGEQSETLRRLADAVYARVELAARAGVEAVDLEDGLRKIADGELEPETLSVALHRKPELGDRRPSRDGFLLRLAGRAARTRSFTPASGYGATLELELGTAELAELASDLAALSPGALPQNLWAPDYNDLKLGVLDREVTVQARRFTGMTSATHGEAQRAFDAIADRLTLLHQLVARDGKHSADG